MKGHVLPLPVRVAYSFNRATKTNFQFLKGGSECNGYIIKRTRENGKSLMPRTKAIYIYLIYLNDMPPTEHDTMLTSIPKINKLPKNIGPVLSIVILDQQSHNYSTQLQ